MLGVTTEVLNQLNTPALNTNTFANRPTFGFTGRLFFSTDTKEIFSDTGTAWNLISDASTSYGYVPYFGATANLDLGIYNLYATNIGVATTSPTAPLDVHTTVSVGAQINNTATGSAFLAFQLNDAGKWRIGNNYNSGSNDFVIYDTVNAKYIVSVKNTGNLFINSNVNLGTLSSSGNALLNIPAYISVTPSVITNASGIFGGSYIVSDTVTAASGTAGNVPSHQLNPVTYTAVNTGVTYNFASTLYISGAPIAGTNVFITNSYSLFIDSGLARFDGGFNSSSNSLFGGLSFISGANSKVQISGSVTGSNTTTIGVHFATGANFYTDNSTAASGTASFAVVNSMRENTFSATNTAVTYTNAATLYISAAPIAGTNVTITNTWALYINSGYAKLGGGFVSNAASLFGGNIFINTSTKLQINGSTTGANLGSIGVHIATNNNSYTDNSTAASGTASFAVVNSMKENTFNATNTSVTYTNAATLYINAAPIAGTNATITNAWAIYTNTGNTRLGGQLTNTDLTFLNSRVNINGATDRSDFQLNTVGSSLTSNTVNIPAAGSISQYSINTLSDVGTALTAGVANAANYGNLIYTSSANRTIANTNPLTGGIFAITPTISGSSTITVSQSSTIRAITAIQAYFHIPSTAASTSTITHAAGIRSYIQADNSANNYTITNYYGVLISNSADTVPSTITNRYGIYQEGSSDINLLNGELRLGSGQTVSASVINTVTNKVKIIINGTTYYLLASTSGT